MSAHVARETYEFITNEWPGIHADCVRAESYLSTDPTAACFYSRRAIEQLVGHLYDVMDLEAPYRTDLAARIGDSTFKSKVGVGIVQKLNLIRRVGNNAAHESRPIASPVALQVLRELFHVLIFAAYRYSTNPQVVPTGRQFDPALAAKRAPLSRDELVTLAAKFKAQDEVHAQALAERDDLAAAKDAEIAELRAQIAAAQAANTKPDDHDYSEAEMRRALIDVLLGEAGWPLDQSRDREYPVTGMPNHGGKGFADYVLWGADGLPLAVVEAKRTTKSPQIGQQQVKLYADCLEAELGRRPVIFYSNCYQHWIWDDRAYVHSGYPPRQVQGFYTRDELELMIQRRQTRLPLAGASIDTGIVERYYQTRAIKAIGAAFDKREHEALLVMATGAGKTRTVIALVDQPMKANWVKRVLFLADRTALVNQAVNAFKAHLPGVTTVNLVTEKWTDGRVYASTYPTILNLIDDLDERGRRFGPGYFDLIVIDEAHRSVYQKYRAIFDWFDSYLVGLTATPTEDTVDKAIATLMSDGYKVAGGDRLGKTIIFCEEPGARGVHRAAIQHRLPRVRRRVRACHYLPHDVRAKPDRQLRAGREGSAHRDQRRHARHRHRRARGRQPRVLQDGALEVEVLADDRPWHPAVS